MFYYTTQVHRGASQTQALLVTDTGHHHKKPWLLCLVTATGLSRRLPSLDSGNKVLHEFPTVPSVL